MTLAGGQGVGGFSLKSSPRTASLRLACSSASRFSFQFHLAANLTADTDGY